MNETEHSFHSAAGFTLIELVLVLVLIGLISGLTAPYVLSTLENMNLQAGAREIASTLRYARSEAVTRKSVFTFNGDAANGRYWLTEPRENRSTQNRSLESGLRMEHRTPERGTIDTGEFSIRFYPGGNSSGGSVRVQAAADKKSETYYEIHIDPITGQPRIRHHER